MTEIRTVFSGVPIDRCGPMRTDPDALVRALHQRDTRFLPVWRRRCLVGGQGAVPVSRQLLAGFMHEADRAIFLGRRNGAYLFAVAIDSDVEPDIASDAGFVDLRTLTSQVPEDAAALLAYARAMVIWHQHHQHCGVCGGPNRSREGGFVMECTDEACGHRSFPRLDPAIIVLTHRGDRCLLGRQASWPQGRFSTIAGFVEPGESLEDAVRREVHEETNIRVGRCNYLASQPWPFPAALMLGFHAEAVTENIRLNDAELADARWLNREEIANRAVVLPPAASIAYRLIEAWFDKGDGPRLDSLDLAGPMLRAPASGQPGLSR